MSVPPLLDEQAIADACRDFGVRRLELFISGVRDTEHANDFDNQAEEATAFYVSLFPNSRIAGTKYDLERSPRPAGSVLRVQFTPDGPGS